MLLRILLSSAPFSEKLLSSLIWIVALLPALTFHEWAHGFMAYKLGDRTAKADGRLSLNPLDHIDPMGALMIAIIGFGWAKPVPVNTRNFKKPKRDLALVSAAGPLMNFLLAVVAIFLVALLWIFCSSRSMINDTTSVIIEIIQYFALINLALGFFNLIPLPPLDGSNILMSLLPPKVAMKFSQIRYYSHYILIGIILLSRLPGAFSPLDWLLYLQQACYNGLLGVFYKLLLPLFL